MDLLEIGKLLKEERLRQGVELADVAKLTRIGPAALAAIEAGDESALPKPVYIKGFVKNYARFLKLDPEVIDKALQDVRFASGNAMWSPSQNLPVKPRPFPVWQAGVAALALVALVGGAGTIYQMRSGETPVQELPPNAEERSTILPPNGVDQPAWQPSPPIALEDQTQLPSPPTATPPVGLTISDPAGPGHTADQDVEEALTQAPPDSPPDYPPVRQDMSLGQADLDNMRLTLRPGNLRADFEIRNLTNDLISGSISVSFLSRDNRTLPALGNEEIPRFSIRNFRPVSTRLHLPADLNLEDVDRVQFVVTDASGTDVLIKTYPVSQG